MKIALLAAASSIHTVRWANAFIERGHSVLLMSQHAPSAMLDEHVRLLRLKHLGGLGYLVNGPLVARAIRRFAPDVVNVHYATGYGTLARWNSGYPLVINVWGSDVFEFPDKGRPFRALLLGNLRRARQLVSTSRFMARRTTSLGQGLPPLAVVPFGVDTERFSPAKPENERGPLVIGTVKTLAPKYGIDTLLRAFALVAARHPDVRLRIVGGGPQERDLKELAGELGIAGLVTFTGPVPHADVPDALRGLDIFVALSRADSETFGVAVIEASACGLPVVVSDAGGLPEVVLDGVTGHVVRRDDPHAAADAILDLIVSPELRLSMGRSGREHALAQYEWSSCVERQLAVFDRVISNNDRA
jgi:glycosyltransferase involved in cell wall biosynthesis